MTYEMFADGSGHAALHFQRMTNTPPGEPPPCDALCLARWADRPHLHTKTEGLHDGESPLFVVALYCSCGFLAEESHYDLTKPLDEQEPESKNGPELLLHHFKTRHGFDPSTDEDWQERMAREP